MWSGNCKGPEGPGGPGGSGGLTGPRGPRGPWGSVNEVFTRHEATDNINFIRSGRFSRSGRSGRSTVFRALSISWRTLFDSELKMWSYLHMAAVAGQTIYVHWFFCPSVEQALKFIAQGVIQQLRGPHFTQFCPPPPSNEQTWKFYIPFSMYLPFVMWPPVDFLLTPSAFFLSTLLLNAPNDASTTKSCISQPLNHRSM